MVETVIHSFKIGTRLQVKKPHAHAFYYDGWIVMSISSENLYGLKSPTHDKNMFVPKEWVHDYYVDANSDEGLFYRI